MNYKIFFKKKTIDLYNYCCFTIGTLYRTHYTTTIGSNVMYVKS